ncbi:hypothetical protein [Mesorhizobium sp.]|uniref:hypothetical protein n=1 Tax=Mesorhizobium sp. TaxID=1871066 RepID=UPI000FE2C621|nr:hypothetical protein [Mesorhizobium sp.]RWN98192.1 MAG: hypothetical protein EOS06_24590 [Mesorhizobium sp.]
MSRINDQNRDRRAPGSGFSVLGASKETEIPEARIRRAIKAGEVKTVRLGGTDRIPKREVERLKELYS